MLLICFTKLITSTGKDHSAESKRHTQTALHELGGVHVGSISEANRALTAPSVSSDERLILNYYICTPPSVPFHSAMNFPGVALNSHLFRITGKMSPSCDNSIFVFSKGVYPCIRNSDRSLRGAGLTRGPE